MIAVAVVAVPVALTVWVVLAIAVAWRIVRPVEDPADRLILVVAAVLSALMAAILFAVAVLLLGASL